MFRALTGGSISTTVKPLGLPTDIISTVGPLVLEGVTGHDRCTDALGALFDSWGMATARRFIRTPAGDKRLCGHGSVLSRRNGRSPVNQRCPSQDHLTWDFIDGPITGSDSDSRSKNYRDANGLTDTFAAFFIDGVDGQRFTRRGQPSGPPNEGSLFENGRRKGWSFFRRGRSINGDRDSCRRWSRRRKEIGNI